MGKPVEQLKYGAIDLEARKAIEQYLHSCEQNEWFKPLQYFCSADTMADDIVRHLWEAGFHIQRHDGYHEQEETRLAIFANLDESKAPGTASE